MIRRALACLAVGLLLGACAGPQLDAHDAWVRAAPDGTALGVAYFTLRNRGPARDLVAVQSDAHETAHIHISELENGVARMRSMDEVRVAADSQLKFEPGGLHVMLMRPVRALKEGDQIELSLEFSDGDSVQVSAQVRKGPP